MYKKLNGFAVPFLIVFFGGLRVRLWCVNNDPYSNEVIKSINFFEQSKLKLRIVAPSTFSCDTK